MKKDQCSRCVWVSDDPIDIHYHDKEWGVPVYDDRLLFEFLILEGAQAGLSWSTVLKKRDNYRAAFDNFNPKRIANYDQKKLKQLLANPGIIRNRLKIQSVVINAHAYLELIKEYRTFSNYLWQFVDHKPIHHDWTRIKKIQATTPVSDKLSKDLKQKGFKFVGSTICYALMQAIGMANDHAVHCFRYAEIKRLKVK